MENIKAAIEQQDFIRAFGLLKTYLAAHPGYTDTIAILEASIYMGCGDYHAALPCIRDGLKVNPANYELYYMLGMVYEALLQNEKAYLCYENAIFHARKHPDDSALICEYFRGFRETTGTSVPKASIILLNYNQLACTIDCVDSIRKYCPSGAFEIIIVDNASEESPEEWLRAQPDIRYCINPENLGFAGGCNVGIRMAKPGNDIFLLNNDTLLTENALFFLRMGLYEDETLGAVGAMSNYAGNRQAVAKQFESLSDCMAYGLVHNVPLAQPLSYRLMLSGFAMLIRHTAVEKTGLLDERFFPGNYEDNDYSTRLVKNGYRLAVCKNSFIYHIGGAGFSTLTQQPSKAYWHAMDVNRQRYFDKWHIKPDYSFFCRTELVDLMDPADSGRGVNCLDIGCACGATLLEIKNRFPACAMYGIEFDPDCAKHASLVATVAQGNIEIMDFPFDVQFDYIFLENILEHLIEPGQLLEKLIPHLSRRGVIITSIPNILHYSAISQILGGSFAYTDSGILDRTHLRFFTLYDSICLLQNAGFEIIRLEKLLEVPNETMAPMKQFLEHLVSVPGIADTEQFYVSQYVFKARPAIPQ